MKILITTTLTKNMTEAKIKPLVALPEVERIFYVSDRPGPILEKVRYYCVPSRILRLSNNNAALRLAFKFFMVFYLAIVKRPDLLMGYSFMPHGINAALIGKILNIPSGVNVIGGAFSVEGGGFTCGKNALLKRLKRKGSFLERILLRIAGGSNFLTVTGSNTRDFLISMGIDGKKIRILSSTIDTKRFFAAGPGKTYDLITLAELIPSKRIDMFLEIVSRLKKERPGIKAVILGDGELKGRLEDLSKSLGLWENVRFAGFDPDVEKYLKDARIFLLPTKSEGLSLSVLEAMACGVVPVVSDVGDLSDAVKDGENGRLVERYDIDGFVRAVSGLLGDPQKLGYCSRNAVETIRRYFTIEKASDAWREILYDIREKKSVLGWYLNRFKAMSASEMIYRFTRALRLKLFFAGLALSGRDGHLCRDARREAGFFIDQKDVDFIREKFGADKYKVLGEIRDVFGHLPDKAFGNDIRRRAGFYGSEIKDIWELNRFKWLVDYSRKYAMEKDEALAEKIVSILRDWIDKNPPMKGLNWLDSLEVSLRIMSWSWIYFLIKGSRAFNEDFEHMFLRSVYAQVSFIKNNLSLYSSANNHLIGEGAGLFIAGILFPSLRGAETWLKKGRAILEAEIKKQVYADGVSREQSVSYHRFVTELYLLAVIIGRKNNAALDKEVYARLEKMCGFILCMADEKGNLASIGDSGMESLIGDARSILDKAGVLFNRPDFKKNDIMDDEGLWLLGREGYDMFMSLRKKEREPVSEGFTESGYYLMRDKGLSLSFDCGELGYLSLAAHGHADALSITLNAGGKDIFVDPGTYLYHSGAGWRDYFRGTRAHNTLRIDGRDQSEIKGPFLWGYKAKAYLKYWSPDGGHDKVCGYHTGYTRLDDPVVHTREVTLDKLKREIIIKDSLVSKKRHFAELYFHLHPDCVVKRLEAGRFKAANGKSSVIIETDMNLETRVFNGSEAPICGWYSGRFGEKQKTSTICARGYFDGSADFITRISIA